MKRKRFFEFFPPPVFLTMPSIGLSIESDMLRVVSLQTKHGVTLLKTAKEHPLEVGVVVAGDIAKPDKLVAALQAVRAEHGAHFARVALPEEKAYVYETIVPVPEEGDVSETVEFSLEQNIPIKGPEAVFDFAVVEGPFAVNGASSARTIVSAYPREITETWVELFKQAGITPMFITPESQAIARSLVPNGDMRTVLIVHFFKDKTIIAVVSQGLVRFTTTIANALENAEKILASHEGENISESVELLAVRDEVKKVHSYWKSKIGAKAQKDGIKSLIVSGHISNMTDVAEYLGKHIETPAMLGNVWQNAFSLDDFVPDLEFEDALRFSAAVGAALTN